MPATRLEFQALAGLETERASESIDLAGKTQATLRMPLVRFARARANGYVAGNTHLHLMKLSKQQADRYLTEVPLADGLDIVFLSYLERAEADLEYTSNHYTPDELRRLSHEHLRFGHGEEHRHNFDSHGEGYGHILLLDIPYIIQPVSIGPGIMQEGTDGIPLQRGIREARSDGAAVIWCHNTFGHEDLPNWVAGLLDAQNIHDGGEHGGYADTYYRYLNLGMKVPFSTGTDWFIYDFSRVYAPVAGELWWRDDCSARLHPDRLEYQPHHQTIRRQDQAQVYQELVSAPYRSAAHTPIHGMTTAATTNRTLTTRRRGQKRCPSTKNSTARMTAQHA